MTCNKCGKELNEEFKVCPYCGTVVSKPRTCEKCGKELQADYKVCPFCGTNAPELVICKYCGTAFEKNKSICPNCRTPLVQRTCKYCGKEIESSATVCPHCGVEVFKTASSDTRPTPLIITLIITFCSVFLVIMLTLIGIVAFTGPDGSGCQKEKPDIASVETLTGAEFIIYANDNYRKVVVEVVVYDKNDVIILSESLVGENYKKGNSYKLILTLNAQQLLSAHRYSYRIAKYS